MTEYSDIAAWAETNGYGNYNYILSLMEKSKMIPGYERKTMEIYEGVGKDYGYNEELCKILDSYVKLCNNGESEEILL